MLLTLSSQRRSLIISITFVFVLTVLFFRPPTVDDRLPVVVQEHDTPKTNSLSAPAIATHAQVDKPAEPTTQPLPTQSESQSQPKPSNENDDDVAHEVAHEVQPEEPPASKPVTSKFHYLIPASNINRRLCFNLASSAVNRFPVPNLMGWNATGLLNAANTHLAKLHAIQRHLHRLPQADDDDIVLIVDGYDVIMQLPAEIMLKRYFKVLDDENLRNAKRWNITVEELWEKGLQTTLFFGADKVCWPIDWRAPRCWAIPDSTLPPKAFGPKTNNGFMEYLIPKWLNSGTVMGPVKDMRALIDATLYEILNTYDRKNRYSESDQLYLGNVFGRQEYYRSKNMNGGAPIKGGPHDRYLPKIHDHSVEIELHIGIEYESAMFQTRAGYDQYVDWVPYIDRGLSDGALSTLMDRDLFKTGDTFRPYIIEMPDEVKTSLSTIYDDISDAHHGTTSAEWIRQVPLGTNFITKHIWSLWHVTGAKDIIEGQYTKFWFYPYVRPLLKASVKKLQVDNRVSADLIGGRNWVYKTVYPQADSLQDELGGAWSDEDGGKWVNYQALCGHWEKDILGGERLLGIGGIPEAEDLSGAEGLPVAEGLPAAESPSGAKSVPEAGNPSAAEGLPKVEDLSKGEGLSKGEDLSKSEGLPLVEDLSGSQGLSEAENLPKSDVLPVDEGPSMGEDLSKTEDLPLGEGLSGAEDLSGGEGEVVQPVAHIAS